MAIPQYVIKVTSPGSIEFDSEKYLRAAWEVSEKLHSVYGMDVLVEYENVLINNYLAGVGYGVSPVVILESDRDRVVIEDPDLEIDEIKKMIEDFLLRNMGGVTEIRIIFEHEPRSTRSRDPISFSATVAA